MYDNRKIFLTHSFMHVVNEVKYKMEYLADKIVLVHFACDWADIVNLRTVIADRWPITHVTDALRESVLGQLAWYKEMIYSQCS